MNIKDTLKVIQIDKSELPRIALSTLKAWAQFKDTNKELDEFMVSTGTVQEILEKAKDAEAIKAYEGIIDKLNETEACYVMITSI